MDRVATIRRGRTAEAGTPRAQTRVAGVLLGVAAVLTTTSATAMAAPPQRAVGSVQFSSGSGRATVSVPVRKPRTVRPASRSIVLERTELYRCY